MKDTKDQWISSSFKSIKLQSTTIMWVKCMRDKISSTKFSNNQTGIKQMTFNKRQKSRNVMICCTKLIMKQICDRILFKSHNAAID